jgi:hypothetical protein
MTVIFPNPEAGSQPQTKRAPGSAVHSHKSYERPARLLCHHSGQYLTVEENNPERIIWLREQHDFPAFKALDDRFQVAAHALEHQHLIWSRPALRGVALLVGAALLLFGVWSAWTRSDQWISAFEGAVVIASLIVGLVGGLTMIAAGFWQIGSRNTIFHRGAHGQRPAIDDFPLFGSYRVVITEAYKQDLANGQREPVSPTSLTGSVTVEVIPEPKAPETYKTYRDTYAAHSNSGVGSHLFAGAVALEGLRFVSFASPVDYDHRIVLRQPTNEQFVLGGEPSRKPVRFHDRYIIDADALRSDPFSKNERAVLAVAPRLGAFDSYTLILTFNWAGEPFECALEECRLAIPPELGLVEQVEHGRRVEENGSTEVIWRNLVMNRDGTLSLSVRFSNPLLGKGAPETLTGSYRFIAGGAVSGLEVPLEQIWDALGHVSLPRTRPSVNSSSVIEGNLALHIAILAQEHEHVATARVTSQDEPTGTLIGKITRVLTDLGVDIHRIEEALPRLDPLGTLNHQLRYWDVIGRKYELAALEAVDVHIVVSGSTRGQRTSNTPTVIDIRVRCLHDPRSPQIAEQADNVRKLIADQLENCSPTRQLSPDRPSGWR